MQWGKGLSDQVCNPVTEIIVASRDGDSLLTIEGMGN